MTAAVHLRLADGPTCPQGQATAYRPRLTDRLNRVTCVHCQWIVVHGVERARRAGVEGPLTEAGAALVEKVRARRRRAGIARWRAKRRAAGRI